MGVLGGWEFSHERGTFVLTPPNKEKEEEDEIVFFS